MTSFSTDFDGIGTGGSMNVDFARGYQPYWFPPVQIPQVIAAQQAAAAAQAVAVAAKQEADRQELQRRYDEQLAAAREKALVEAARRRAEEAARARALEQARVTAIENVMKDYMAAETLAGDPGRQLVLAMATQRALQLEQSFKALEAERAAAQLTFFQYLVRMITGDRPPPTHYKSALVWGLWTTPAEAAAATAAGTPDPFNPGETFEKVFAFGTASTPIAKADDLGRVALDHFLATGDALSLTSLLGADGLRGATVDNLVCHSNGCRVVQVMIESGELSVGTLRILGGDGVLGEIDNLKALKAAHSIDQVSVYVIDGDIVPHSDILWSTVDAMNAVGHGLVTCAPQKDNSTYQFMGLVDRPRFDPAADVQVHCLTPPPSAVSVLDKHHYSTYSDLLTVWHGGGGMTQGQLKLESVFH